MSQDAARRPQPAPRPSVAIVTVNYNGLEHLADCFDSLRRLDYPADRFEVVCVDNDSVDGSVDFIREHYPEVRLIESGDNLGFAAGCNLGALRSEVDCIAFLNNDARVDPAWLSALVHAIAVDDETVCAAAKILDWEGDTVDFVEGHLSFHGFARQTFWRTAHAEGAFAQAKPLLFACGGAMLVQRDVFLDAGGFDERFWMFFEDVDLGWRLWLLGHRVVFAPEALTYHRHHGSAGKLSTYRRNFLYERNGLMMIVKNYDDASLARALPASLALMVHRSTDYLQRASGGFDMLAPEIWHALDAQALEQPISLGDLAPLVALRAVLEQLPELMRERERLQARRRRPDRDILALFGQPRRLYPMGHLLVQAYCEAQQSLWQALGLDRLFADVPARVAMLTTQGPPGMGFALSHQGQRAERIAGVLEAAGHDVIWCLPESILQGEIGAALPGRIHEFAWNDRKLDNRLLELGPDVVIATHWRCLAFARLSVFRPLVLDHDPSDPLPEFERELEAIFENPSERTTVRAALLRRDFLQHVDLFTCEDATEITELRRWLQDEAKLSPDVDRFHALSLTSPSSEREGPVGSLPPGVAGLDAFCRVGAYRGDRMPIDFRPPFPHTPAWELPIKAWRSLRKRGAAALARDLQQYLRWLYHSLQRRLAR